MQNQSVITSSFSSSSSFFLRKTTFNSQRSTFLHCEVFPTHLPQSLRKERKQKKPWLILQCRLLKKKKTKKTYFYSSLKKSQLMAAAREHEGAERS
jgi:hypothetical protein